MGVGASTDTNWAQPPTGDRDYWGYTPGGLVPSQRQWSQLYVDGIPPFHAAVNPYSFAMAQAQSNKTYQFGNSGQGADILQTFGPTLPTDSRGGNAGGWVFNGRYDQLPTPTQMFPLANSNAWNWKADQTYCTPETYPQCDMSQWMQENDKGVHPFASWWGEVVDVQNQPGGNLSVVTNVQLLPEVPQAVDVPARWNKMVNDVTENYLAGNLEALDSVNSQNTAGFDPCEGSGFFEKVLPLLTGAAAVVIPNLFGFEIITVLPADTKAALDLTLALVGYDAGKVAYLGADSRAQRYKEKAATAVCLGAGYIGGSIGVNYVVDSPTPLVHYGAAAAGAWLTNRLLYEPVLVSFVPAAFGLGLAGLLFRILDDISGFFCRLANWGYLACNDPKFADARKWDVASVAAQIADRVAAGEGWSKEDPRREFVFRGLVTGPALLYAATDDTDKPGIFRDRRTNPLGSWLQVHTSNAGIGSNNGGEVTQFFNGEYSSITGGDETTGWWGNHQDHNRYACNNMDIILKGWEYKGYKDDSESGPEKERDALLSERLNVDYETQTLGTWIKELVAKARDPNNIRAQGQIGGLQGATEPRFDYDSDVYLKTCADDFHHAEGEHYGTGFNHIRERGQYALGYSKEVPNFVAQVKTAKEAYLLANMAFASYPNESKALDYFESKHVHRKNVAFMVQYWHAPKGDAQRFTFDSNWRSKDDPRVSAYLAEEVSNWSFPFVIVSAPTPLKWQAQSLRFPLHGLQPGEQPLGPGEQPIDPVSDPLQPPDKTGPIEPMPSTWFPATQNDLFRLDALLKAQGWGAVKQQLIDIGFYQNPAKWGIDMFTLTMQVYANIALGNSPTQVVQFIGSNPTFGCDVLFWLESSLPVIWSQFSPSLQSWVHEHSRNNCTQ